MCILEDRAIKALIGFLELPLCRFLWPTLTFMQVISDLLCVCLGFYIRLQSYLKVVFIEGVLHFPLILSR